MTLIKYLFEGTPEAAMTAGNTGAQQISLAGGTAVFSTATKQTGATGGLLSSSGGDTLARFMADAPADDLAIEAVLTLPETQSPTLDHNLLTVRHTSGPAMGLYLDKVGVLYVGVTGMPGTTSLTTDGAAEYHIDLGAKYRVSLVLGGASTTDGTVAVELYTPTGTTPLAYVSLTGQNMNANQLAGIDIKAPDGITLGIDDLQLDDGRTSKIGPLVEEVELDAPVVTLSKTDPTTHGGSDGEVPATWLIVTGAGTYESCILEGTVTSGFVSTRADGTRARTFTGLSAGTYTVAVRALP